MGRITKLNTHRYYRLSSAWVLNSLYLNTVILVWFFVLLALILFFYGYSDIVERVLAQPFAYVDFTVMSSFVTIAAISAYRSVIAEHNLLLEKKIHAVFASLRKQPDNDLAGVLVLRVAFVPWLYICAYMLLIWVLHKVHFLLF